MHVETTAERYSGDPHAPNYWARVQGTCWSPDGEHRCQRPHVFEDSRDYPHPGGHWCGCDHRWPTERPGN